MNSTNDYNEQLLSHVQTLVNTGTTIPSVVRWINMWNQYQYFLSVRSCLYCVLLMLFSVHSQNGFILI